LPVSERNDVADSGVDCGVVSEGRRILISMNADVRSQRYVDAFDMSGGRVQKLQNIDTAVEKFQQLRLENT